MVHLNFCENLFISVEYAQTSGGQLRLTENLVTRLWKYFTSVNLIEDNLGVNIACY